MAQAYLSSVDRTSIEHGVLCRRADDYAQLGRDAIALARVLRWLVSL